jgi:predicted phage terminase large subunit-like protein
MMSREQKAQIAEAIRVKAQRELLPFIMWTKPGYLAGWFQHVVCEAIDQFIEDVLAHRSPRLMLFAPPRHGKSEIVSRSMPAFAFGKNPDLSIIATSYSNDLASSMNRDVQRRIDTPEYHQLFPDTTLSRSSVRTVTAAGAFMRNSDTFEIVDHTGLYKSAGVQTGISGRGFDIGIIDDPVKDAQEAGSQTVRDSVWAWYLSTFFTRCMPGAGILVIMCMTGDTPVLMADGTETPLRDVRAGDTIATYENGELTTSTVRHWKNQGCDLTYGIKTISGTIVKANERHPFLVCRNGDLEWVRLQNLKVGDKLVRAAINAGSGANGAALSALLMGAKSQPFAKACAPRTTAKRGTLLDSIEKPRPKKIGCGECAIDMVLSQKSSTRWSPNSMASALSVESCPQEATVERTGQTSFALTTTTPPAEYAGSCATIATSPLDMVRQKEFSSQPLSTFEINLDEIVEIVEAGYEDVFDIQVDRTENFIANGLVSHNTRWHADDLAGRLLAQMERGGEQWKVLRFPAIAETNETYRRKGEPLHAERYSLEMLNSIRKGTSDAKGATAGVGSQVWASLYQQRPSLIEGNIFKEQNWRYIKSPTVPPSMMSYKERRHYLRELGITRVIQVWDTALGAKKQSDFSACVTLGVAPSRFYVIDVWKKQIEFPEVKRQVQLLYDKWVPAKVYIEGGGSASGKATVQAMKRDARVPIYETVHAVDKVLRANAVSPQQESGFCYLFEGEDWTHDFVSMCSAFPNITHDDDVDAFIGALEEAVGRRGPMNIPDSLLRSEGAIA